MTASLHSFPSAAQPVALGACGGATGHASGDVLVTRPQSLTDETAQAIAGAVGSLSVPFFVDWLSISQTYPEGGLPLVDSGAVLAVDADGVLQWKCSKAVQHEGSYETSVNVKSDGFRVSFSGNVSRFGRADNLFGFDLATCVQRINSILSFHGLPPFTIGQRIEFLSKGEVRYGWTGARISRIDLTANYSAGSADNAHAVLQFLGSQHAGRHEGRVLGQGETVAWGVGSRRQYWKCYIKHLELARHGCEDQRLIGFCRDLGLVRFEGTLRSNALSRFGCAFLGDFASGWAMGELVRLFNEHAVVMDRAEKTTDDLDDLPRHLRATARDYMAGMDCMATLSRATFYRHRKELLAFGIDIAVRNVAPFKPRVNVIHLKPVSVPDWYRFAA